MREAIRQAVAAFRAHIESDDEVILAALVSNGIQEELAARLIEFVPLAFSRALFFDSGVQFTDLYFRIKTDGKSFTEHNLKDEPVFVEAFALARSENAGRGGDNPFLAIASRSSEFRAIQKALHDGSRLEDLECSPPVMRRTEPEKAIVCQPKGRKRWWEFWK